MVQGKIEQALDKIFAQGNKGRLVFWYDEKNELRGDFDALQLDDVEKVVVENNEYVLKHRMLKEQPKQKFLIFREGKRPKDIDNWLLDLELAYSEFRTDQNALWVNELGLMLEDIPLVEAHKEFFNSKKRREAFKKLLDARNPGDGDIKRKIMLAICTNAKLPRIDSALEAMLEDLSHGKQESSKLIDRCGLSEFLWKEVQKYYVPMDETPPNSGHFVYRKEFIGIEDFIIEAFKSSFYHEIGEAAVLKNNIIGFLNRWKNDRHNGGSFETLSHKYASILKIDQKLEDLDFRKLIEIDYFEDIDKKILSSLVSEVRAMSISADECSNIIRQRRRSHWFKNYRHAYEAVDYACQFMVMLDQAILTPQSLNDGVHKYTSDWYRIDQLYRKFIYSMRSFNKGDLLKGLADRIEQLYSNKYLLTLSDNWQKHIDKMETWSGFDAIQQKNFFTKHVQPVLDADKKTYVIISDAFRYEIGQELVSRILREDRYEARIDPAISQLPSYTQLGMSSLLPNTEIEFSDDETGRVVVDGITAAGTANRNKILAHKKGSAVQCKEFMELDRDQSRQLLKENNFLYLYHNHIDFVGDKRDSEERVFDAAEKTIEELIDVIKKLTNANATNIIITADHGFLFQNRPLDESDYLSAEAKGEILYHDRRFVLGKNLEKNDSFKSFNAQDLKLKGNIDVLIPKSINRLRKQGSGSRFVHGGATLQEIVIPVIKVTKKRQSDTSCVDVEVLQGTTNTITSGQHSVVFYQKEPATEKMHPRILKVGIWADNELISDSHEIPFDNSASSPREREMKVRFILTKKADEYNNKEVTLRLEEKIHGTSHYKEYKSVKFIIRRSFTSDFDF
jgi:uncharacterized protein (TIGR02687 family)